VEQQNGIGPAANTIIKDELRLVVLASASIADPIRDSVLTEVSTT